MSSATSATWTSTNQVPQLILELVVDLFICAMIPLPLEALATEENSVTQSNGDEMVGYVLYRYVLYHII